MAQFPATAALTGGAAKHQVITTVLDSMKATRPSTPPPRPAPDCLKPPKPSSPSKF